MSTYVATHAKSPSFHDRYERRGELAHQTHYCPGCGHGVAHKLVAEAIEKLSLRDRAILVSPVGCSVFAYYYFDFGNVQAAHGRAPAVACAIKRSHPDSIVLSYQGDGDLAAIGTAEIVHAANRGEPITVFFINNAIYGMTGGQLAPTTLLGQRTTTTPLGRNIANEGYPLRVCELLATLEAPVYIERVALGDSKQIMKASRAVRRAIEIQEAGLGFALVEILSPCPTVWKQTPVDAKQWVRDEMTKVFPLGVFRDRREAAAPRAPAPREMPLDEIPDAIGIAKEPISTSAAQSQCDAPTTLFDLRFRIGGFGGQGVLLLGEILARAGLHAGLEVSWLPSYGPEMRSGTSNCHVRLRSLPIDSPLVASPNILLALNEPALRKFLPSVSPRGWVFYDGEHLPGGCERAGVRVCARPFSEIANRLGEPRAANIALLGAMIGATGALSEEHVNRALEECVANERWREIDRRALRAGLDAGRGGRAT
jgi:2-oxoisovalerate ferredoxin oxidoreductase beta subunit